MTDNERYQKIYEAQERNYRMEAQKTLAEQLERMRQDMQGMLRPIKAPKYQDHFNVAGSDAFSTTTGNTKRLDPGTQVSKTFTNHGNGFWSIIRITEDDYVYYKLFRGRWSLLLSKLGFKNPSSRSDWNYIQNQGAEGYKLEAELGKTYLLIDELIAEHLEEKQEKKEHKKFIKGIASADPENLKMIAGLKKLDEGMTEPLEEPDQGPLSAFGLSATSTTASATETAILNVAPEPFFGKKLCETIDDLKGSGTSKAP